MSANNRRVRRRVVEILWAHGAMTRNELSSRLQKEVGLREIPSNTSLSSILAKNVQVVSLGFEDVELHSGSKAKHMVFALDSNLIREYEDILYSRPFSSMTTWEKNDSMRCAQCGRRRVFPPDSEVCIHCMRKA